MMDSQGRDTRRIHDGRDHGNSSVHDEFIHERGLKRRRRRIKFALALVTLALAVWIAPTIVAHTSLRDRLVNVATSKIDGKVGVGSASFGWLSPVRLYNVRVDDREGSPVLDIDAISTERTLLGLVLHSRDPGLVRIDGPHLTLVLRPDGSNLEDLLVPLMDESSDSSGERIPLSLAVTDGSVEVRDTTSGRRWEVADLMVDLDIVDAPETWLAVVADGQVRADDGRSGKFHGEVSLNDPEKSASDVMGQVVATTQTLPIDAIEPLLSRFAGPIHVSGDLTSDVTYAWGASNAHQVDVRKLSGERISLAASRWLGADRLENENVTARGTVVLHGDRVEFQEVRVESEVLKVSASGGMSLASLAASGGAAPLALLQNEDFSIHAETDLAALAQRIPRTLRIREGTQLTSGKLDVSLDSRTEGDRRTWKARIAAEDLSANDQGRRIQWNEPIQLAFEASEGETGIVVDKLVCQSSFLQAEGHGSRSEGQLTVTGDLSRLSNELGRFVDLGPLHMAGGVRAEVNWNLEQNRHLTLKGSSRLHQFELTLDGSRPWRESELVVGLDLAGLGGLDGLRSLDTGSIFVQSGEDRLDLALTRPISDLRLDQDWPLRGKLVGELSRWAPRLQSFVTLDGWDVAGQADATVEGEFSRDRATLRVGNVDIRELRLAGAALNIIEPHVQIGATGQWNAVERVLQLPTVTVASSALALRGEDVRVAPAGESWGVAANVGFRSDLARLTSWVAPAGTSPPWKLAGMASGQTRLSTVAGKTAAKWAVDVENLVYAKAASAPTTVAAARPSLQQSPPQPAPQPAMQTVWAEPRVHLGGEGEYDASTGQLQLAQADVESESMKVIAHGTVSDLAGRCLTQLDGEVGYDLAQVVARFRGALGPSIEVTGRDVRKFAVRGPLLAPTVATHSPSVRLTSTGGQDNSPNAAWPPPELAGQAALAWATASAYGLPIGPGELSATLDKGVVDVKPLQVEVAEGRLQFAPRIYMDRPDMLLVAPAGPVLDDVRISPELCANWLKYVLPILADITAVEGKFSLALADTAAIPLAAPIDSEVHGSLSVHNVQVGPGPLAREIIGMAMMIQSIVKNSPAPNDAQASKLWVALPEQQIPFHWKQRRVYHEKLVMQVQDVTLVTRGSVGMDQSLDLVAEVPIRDEWVAANRYLASLKGQKLQIPINGSLTAPRVDRRVFQQITTQAISNSANKLLEQELSRGLDRLLKPRTTNPPAQPQPQP